MDNLKKITIGLLTAELNNGNMGCNALTLGAIILLEEVSKKIGCGFQYILFSANDSRCLSSYEELRGVDISFCEPTVHLRSIAKMLLRNNVKKIFDFRTAINDCKVFFEIAGGDSYSDIYGINRPITFDKYHTKIIKKKVPLIFLPQTIGPFKSDKAKKIAKKGLSYAAHVFARDPISFNKAKQISKNISISQTIDMAFFMDYTPINKSKKKLKVGLNPSGLLWDGGYTRNNQFGLKVDYEQLMRQMIKSLDPERFDIILVPHVLSGPGYSFEDDYKVCKCLKADYPHCLIAPFFYTPVEAKSFISGLDLLAGSRMHCCIGAYSAGVPIYPLAYSRKFKGLFKDQLNYPYGAELTLMDVDAVLIDFLKFVSGIKVVTEEMPGRIEELADYKKNLIKSLSGKISEVLA
nr:polysaccharide pyruvyl transferase family protein [uncultured Desulfobacter sp.]